VGDVPVRRFATLPTSWSEEKPSRDTVRPRSVHACTPQLLHAQRPTRGRLDERDHHDSDEQRQQAQRCPPAHRARIRAPAAAPTEAQAPSAAHLVFPCVCAGAVPVTIDIVAQDAHIDRQFAPTPCREGTSTVTYLPARVYSQPWASRGRPLSACWLQAPGGSLQVPWGLFRRRPSPASWTQAWPHGEPCGGHGGAAHGWLSPRRAFRSAQRRSTLRARLTLSS
jgi:hypothetical protein